MQELEEKYPRIINETTLASQAALSATSMEPSEDPDNYIMKAAHICSRLAAVNELVTDNHFADTVVQGLPESYRDIKLTISKDPDFGLTKTQATMRHLYLDAVSRNHRVRTAGRGTAMATVLPVWFLESPSR